MDRRKLKRRSFYQPVWVRIVQDWVYHICFVQTFSLPFPPLGIPHHARPLTRTTPAAIGVKG
jgi:hypothetical protein